MTLEGLFTKLQDLLTQRQYGVCDPESLEEGILLCVRHLGSAANPRQPVGKSLEDLLKTSAAALGTILKVGDGGTSS